MEVITDDIALEYTTEITNKVMEISDKEGRRSGDILLEELEKVKATKDTGK